MSIAPTSWAQYQEMSFSILYENENNLMYSIHGFSECFIAVADFSSMQAHLIHFITTFLCHLVNHLLPPAYELPSLQSPNFYSETAK